MAVLVLDYGMGNLGSVRRAFEECGADEVLVSDSPKDLRLASHIVLPGVGAFAQGMENLKRAGWITPLKEAITNQQVPLLGICLGMQLLADKGLEGGEINGLGLVPGVVRRLVPTESEPRVPHMGWNEVETNPSNLFNGIASNTDFYFVHSYHFCPKDENSIVGRTSYCGRFISAIENDKIFGVQFHPEKSQKPGFQLLRNFLAQ